jgi:uncharacterized coiled-coil DUF342 family protein
MADATTINLATVIVAGLSALGTTIATGAVFFFTVGKVTANFEGRLKAVETKTAEHDQKIDGHSTKQQELHSENKEALAKIRVEIAELKGAIPHADDLRDMRREANEQHRLMAGQVADVSRRIDELMRRS